jgi:hypothetical protein
VSDDGNEFAPGIDRQQPRDDTRDAARDKTRDEFADELERQARETMRVIRESAGDLGERVRRVLDHAAGLWDQAAPNAAAGAETSQETNAVVPIDDRRARTLARRWKTIDFLVDPEVPDGMNVVSVEDAAAWRIELRERGETRSLAEATEPYRGDRPVVLMPTLPVWDYNFPAIPEIVSGERRERLGDSGMIGACLVCNGTGHRACAHCGGKGFVECPVCHGRSRVMCRRCRGRGHIADPQAERTARSARSYMQVHAERIAVDAAGRVADLSERLRQEFGVPLPPSAQWLPTAPASGETIPCPECVGGKVACTCGNGKLVCDGCRGSGHAACSSCGGSGRVVRYREVVRRFDTRHSTKAIPAEDAAIAHLVGVAEVRRATGDEVWEGSVEQLDEDAPARVPASVWIAASELAREHLARHHVAHGSHAHNGAAAKGKGDGGAGDTPQGERRVLSRQVRITRIPLTRVEYTFAGHPFAFLAVGRSGAERFWAETFPPRWSRVGRFLKAVLRDLDDLGTEFAPKLPGGPADVAVLEEYRARRASNGASREYGNRAQRIRIVEDSVAGATPHDPESPSAPDESLD